MLIDVDDGLYVLRSYGKAMTRLPKWKPHPRIDLILWGESSFTSELAKDLSIDDGIYPTIRQSVIRLFTITGTRFANKKKLALYLASIFV